ncbi:hypothetical protein [Moraxella catarrhalis]|uniref:hypothetical protein n=1 Tax=Moraxella catarrhalis TaxID=480 RepID=UPI00128E72BB|nr:hypothetical protein [Moraxella catarrhalis]
MAQTALDIIIDDNAEKAEKERLQKISAITASTSVSSRSISNALTRESRIQTVVYNQPYSIVLGNYSGNISYNNQSGAIFNDNRDTSITVKGLRLRLKLFQH